MILERKSGSVDGALLRPSPRELRTGTLSAESIRRTREALRCRYCALQVEIFRADGGLDLGFGVLSSRDLARNLAGCDTAWLFCATLGPELDRLMHRLGVTSPAAQFETDGLASALVEALCDRVEEELCLPPHPPRFSPGYGDLPLEVQQAFLQFLDAGRQAGVSLTEGYYMVPSKSVTAIVGVPTHERN